LAKFNPNVDDEARVPPGNGRESGEWTRLFDWLAGLISQLDPISSADAAEATNGRAPYDRHQAGVKAAIELYRARGYTILSEKEISVSVEGFPTPRKYDFPAYDPIQQKNIGVEVKTTLWDTIRLDASQVAKDVVVMLKGGVATELGVRIEGVGYVTFCYGCEMVDLRSRVLHDTLRDLEVPFIHGGRPGEQLP
jgi:hypothetical protein